MRSSSSQWNLGLRQAALPGFTLLLWALWTGAAAAQPTVNLQEASMKIDTDAGVVWVEARLSAPANHRVLVDYGCEDGFGPEGAVASRDYTPSRGTLEFPAGTTSQWIRVPFAPDAVAEHRKHFSICLRNARNAQTGLCLLGIFIGPTEEDEDDPPGVLPPPKMPLPVFPIEAPPEQASMSLPTLLIPATILLGCVTGGFVFSFLKKARDRHMRASFLTLREEAHAQARPAAQRR